MKRPTAKQRADARIRRMLRERHVRAFRLQRAILAFVCEREDIDLAPVAGAAIVAWFVRPAAAYTAGEVADALGVLHDAKLLVDRGRGYCNATMIGRALARALEQAS